MNNLHTVNKITLFRVENGWVATTDTTYIKQGECFAFESTESLAAQLVDLVGHSGWKVIVPQEVPTPRKPATVPERGAGGKFLPKHKDAVQGL